MLTTCKSQAIELRDFLKLNLFQSTCDKQDTSEIISPPENEKLEAIDLPVRHFPENLGKEKF